MPPIQLFAEQGLVSEDNLTLLEGFLSPKASKKKSLKEKKFNNLKKTANKRPVLERENQV